MRLPFSSSLPSPIATILPFCGFSLAVSGSTRPLAVVCSSSIACTIRRSPRGLSFILKTSALGIRPAARDAPRSIGHLSGTLRWRVPTTPPIYRSGGVFQGQIGSCQARVPTLPSVLGAAEAFHRLGQAGRLVHDLGEAHN